MTDKKLKVEVRFGAKGVCYSNILWTPAHPMRRGAFPSSHPCAEDPKAFTFDAPAVETSTNIGRFRARGYWASCFPEGDGITFWPDKDDKPRQQQIDDIEECFRFEVIP